MKRVLLLLVSCFLVGCFFNRYDYSEFKMDDTIKFSDFKAAKQIIPMREGLLVLRNLFKSQMYYERHLLFYDDDMKLQSITYFPVVKINQVSNSLITGLMINGANNSNQYRNDGIADCEINILNEKNRQTYGGFSNKIIQSINIEDEELVLVVKCSKDKYDGFSVGHGMKPKELESRFNIIDTLRLRYENLVLDENRNRITTYLTDSNNIITSYDEMVVLDKNIFKLYYSELCKLVGFDYSRLATYE